MDFITRPFVELFRPFPDSEFSALRIWKPASPDAPKIEGQHIWGTDFWREYGGGPPETGPGPVPGSQRYIPWDGAFPSWGDPVGPADWWENGIPHGVSFPQTLAPVRFRIYARTETGYVSLVSLPLAFSITAETESGQQSAFTLPMDLGIEAETESGQQSAFTLPMDLGIEAETESGGGGVDQCGCTGIPETLVATFGGTGGYSWLDSQTCNLVWDGTKWAGTVSNGGQTAHAELQCVTGSWRFILNCSISGTIFNRFASLSNCSPFSAQFPPGLTGATPCNTGGGGGAGATVATS